MNMPNYNDYLLRNIKSKNDTMILRSRNVSMPLNVNEIFKKLKRDVETSNSTKERSSQLSADDVFQCW
ncbi:hypothetical protein T08_1587 [Trichinella sp. T8]|nr:hypothetical protein T08_1587 [Trichinella sp. T8]